MKQKDLIALIYRIIIVIISFIALFLNYKFETFRIGILYFTNISNSLCFLYYLYIVIMTLKKKLKKNNFYYNTKGMMTIYMLMTMLIYNILLSSTDGMTVFKDHQLETLLVHLIVPLLTIFDYILFGTKGKLKKNYPYLWSIPLILYQVIITIYSILGGRFANNAKYPYFYMDTSKFGIKGVLINIFLILIIFIIFGNIIQIIDNKIALKKENL